MLNRIRLDDLLSRDVTVQWFEGVAIVQGVCRIILADLQSERGFPSTEHILLCADGRIELVGTASAASSVAAGGHTLSQMLSEDAPVRLRLVATQATAGSAGYPTVQEFSEALTYFERPDADGILRSVYNRAADARPRAGIPQVTPPERKTSDIEPAPKTIRPRRGLVLAAISGVVACAALLGVALGSEGTAASVATSVQHAVRSTLDAVTPAAPVAKTGTTAETSGTIKAPDRRTAGRSLPPAEANTAKDRPRREAAAFRGAPLASLPKGWSAPTHTLSGPAVFYTVSPDGSPAAPLYSARHSEVVPPKSVYPKLPAVPPSGFSLSDHAVLELVIGSDGLVERVKLRSEPRNIHEFMLVSAAKAWKFEPARRGGTPVRYMHTVVLALQ